MDSGSPEGRDPRLVPVDYKTRFSQPISKIDEGGKVWYKGTGVAPADHPLRSQVAFGRGFGKCGYCHSPDVLVVAARYTADAKADTESSEFELSCRACGRFTARSFSED